MNKNKFIIRIFIVILLAVLPVSIYCLTNHAKPFLPFRHKAAHKPLPPDITAHRQPVGAGCLWQVCHQRQPLLEGRNAGGRRQADCSTSSQSRLALAWSGCRWEREGTPFRPQLPFLIGPFAPLARQPVRRLFSARLQQKNAFPRLSQQQRQSLIADNAYNDFF